MNVLSLPCQYQFFGAISYIMQLFSLNHILNSRLSQLIADFPEDEMRNLALGVCEAVVTDDELGVNGGAGVRE